MSKHHVTIDWAGDEDAAFVDEDPVETYHFDTKDQLNQFMFGVMECYARSYSSAPKILEDSRD